MLLIMTIVALVGVTADTIVPGTARRRARTAGAGYRGPDTQHRPSTPAAACRTRSQSPWNTLTSTS